ncbi:IS66 family insertion sequence element accessory protein TnpB [Lichenicola cladoniae]|uniref:IS66 family insertion sequence element accessory protein TnpB n=1 Tax=Lichenicola cladoniae TaxID=1484109 RepID=A0A6M8HL22_9PROT|nr:IS66 family insertion sequence element accessory protein TnpB [Lichenicola cladoniae]NPD65163.1 IS66 family insertion sequence element accessory protein TnpB [Acetobacteraceae bacterium]QKE88765.1 IS66 family insertion sequence element accessory protein TnpB [Lichenicola cladoniae]
MTDNGSCFTPAFARIPSSLGLDPSSGSLFLFRGRRDDLLRCLFWDTHGLVLYAKCLERGRVHTSPPVRRGR